MKKIVTSPIAAILTERETDIIHLIIKEYSTKEIANALFLSTETIKTHRRNIFKKLGVRNVAGLVRESILHGIVKHENILLSQTQSEMRALEV